MKKTFAKEKEKDIRRKNKDILTKKKGRVNGEKECGMKKKSTLFSISLLACPSRKRDHEKI
jgi:hypothetical protein